MEAVHVVGAGGIGCAVGYALRAAGWVVTFVDADRRKVEAGRRNGVRVDDRPPMAAEFVSFAEWSPPVGVPVLLCTKCYDNAAVLAKRPDRAMLIPVQNGFDPQLDAYGHGMEGIASFVSECAADRPHTRITRAGALHLGGRDSNPVVAAAEPSAALARSTLFRVVQLDSISPIKNTKLMYNAAISPIAAAAGIDNGKLLSVPAARRLFFALIQENYRVLTAAGAPLGTVGPFSPKTVSWILRRKWLAGLMARAFEPSLRGTYCSMAGDIERGRTEMDNYNGHLIRLAERAETPCPLNRAVYERVRRMAAEGEKPHLGVLEDLAEHFPPSRPASRSELLAPTACAAPRKG